MVANERGEYRMGVGRVGVSAHSDLNLSLNLNFVCMGRDMDMDQTMEVQTL